MEKLPYTINMGPKANHIRLSERGNEDDTAGGEETAVKAQIGVMQHKPRSDGSQKVEEAKNSH